MKGPRLHEGEGQARLGYDVVVVGGGIAGVFAAIGASTLGSRVLLVDQNASLGGQGTLTGERGFCGDVLHVNRPFAEILESLRKHHALGPVTPTSGGTTFDGEILAFLLQEKVLAGGVEILFHTSLVDVAAARGRVSSLMLHNKSGLQRVKGRYVIDCTGEGDLAAMAGFPTVKGGEVHTPDGRLKPGLTLQLPMSLCFWMEDVGSRVEPLLPPGCPTWRGDEDIPMTSIGQVSPHTIFVKMKVVGGDVTVGKSYSEAEIRARRQMMGLVYHLQTKGYRGRLYDTYRLARVSPGLGIREGRRIVGEYVLTESDVRKGGHFCDAVAVGSYQIDYHWPDILQRAGTGITDMVPPYQIPFRSLVPKGGKNILAAGRCVSGDQMAMSSFRVMTTCAQTGFAAGLACGLASSRGVDLPRLDVRSLQRTLEKHGQSLNTTPYRRYRRQRRMVSELVLSRPLGMCHAPTLLELDNSETLVAWYAGTGEGCPDTAIWAARRTEEEWGEPTKIAHDADVAHWNPVLFKDPRGPIHLFYRVGPDSARAAARFRTSRDNGQTWSRSKDLVPGDPSTRGPTKNKVIILANGDWLAPSSTKAETAWDAFVDISSDRGKSWVRSQPVPLDHERFEGKGIIQPALWESEPNKIHMLVRSTCGLICRSDSEDGGRTWCPAYPTSLPSNNSGIDVARLEDGELVLAYNPVSLRSPGLGKRTPLVVSLSEDNGHTWPFTYVLDGNGPRDGKTRRPEFSYPSAVPSPEGVSLAYTWKRSNIAFRRLSIEHIKGC